MAEGKRPKRGFSAFGRISMGRMPKWPKLAESISNQFSAFESFGHLIIRPVFSGPFFFGHLNFGLKHLYHGDHHYVDFCLKKL
jgi:hypothetical protein